jgi:hypothetical protein
LQCSERKVKLELGILLLAQDVKEQATRQKLMGQRTSLLYTTFVRHKSFSIEVPFTYAGIEVRQAEGRRFFCCGETIDACAAPPGLHSLSAYPPFTASLTLAFSLHPKTRKPRVFGGPGLHPKTRKPRVFGGPGCGLNNFAPAALGFRDAEVFAWGA